MTRRGGILAAGVVAVLLLGTVWFLVSRSPGSSEVTAASPECVVQPADSAGAPAVLTVPLADTTARTQPGDATLLADDALSLTAVQLQHAATINAVGVRRGLPDRARVIAVATALQESSLRNLSTGDRDSVGLFQQRPSQGWGTVAELTDPVYAAGAFYDALVDVSNWSALSLTEAAQAVQYSAYPDAYAKWEPAATHLTASLSSSFRSVSCRAAAVAPTAEGPVRDPVAGTAGMAPALRDLIAAADAELGGITLIDIATSTDSPPHSAVVTSSINGLTAEQSAAVLAAWAVSHATGSSVTDVSVADQRWADHQWQPVLGSTLAAGRVNITVASAGT